MALAALPGMGPARLAAVLRRASAPKAWAQISRGDALDDPEVRAVCRPDPDALARVWRRSIGGVDVARLWAAYRRFGIEVAVLGGPGYPAVVAADHEAPAVLFWQGDIGALEGPRVAIVGARQCTQYGREVANQLGRDLAQAGVRVVSGLARGIDGAAHVGALTADRTGSELDHRDRRALVGPPIGVVGSGLDVPYPSRHAPLWAQVAEAGVLVGEAPLGAQPEAWRFPLRNRILAAVADVVVVVESHLAGGSRHTVDAADSRGRTIMAVPGSVRSPASAYPNELLALGRPPARDAEDVLVALSLVHAGSDAARGNRREASGPVLSAAAAAGAGGPALKSPVAGARREGRGTSHHSPRPVVGRRTAPDHVGAAVLDAMGWEPATLETIVVRSGLSPAQASVGLTHLECDGWVTVTGGRWERLGECLPPDHDR